MHPTGTLRSFNLTNVLRSQNHVRKHMSPAQMTELKAKVGCLHCKELRYRRQKCSLRYKSPSDEFMLSPIQDQESGEEAVAKTLWVILEDEEECHA